MRAQPVKLTALTDEEQQYAEEHYDTLLWCMHLLRIPDDYYGVAAIGYLQAVKKWHARLDLHNYSFRTIAKNSIRSRIGREYEKENRQIKTVSLDDVIPGTEDLTYGSTVTYENMRYLYRKERKVALGIKYDVKIPEAARLGRAQTVETEMLAEFLNSNHKNMALSYDEARTASNKAYTLRSWLKKRSRDDVKVYKLGTDIYVEKVPSRKRG